jgi:glycine hydroxymethyltransferase
MASINVLPVMAFHFLATGSCRVEPPEAAMHKFEKFGRLAVNKNLIPFDPRPPEAPSGLRLSSNAGTTRGFGVSEFLMIARWIARVLQVPADALTIATVREEVRALCRKRPIY